MSEEMKTRNPLHVDINAYSVAALMSRQEEISHSDLKVFSAKLMDAISRECVKQGAIDIGHIKAYIEYETGFLFIDTLGDPADITLEGRSGAPTSSFRIVINSVIYGLDTEKIRTATEEALSNVSRDFSLKRSPDKINEPLINVAKRRMD